MVKNLTFSRFHLLELLLLLSEVLLGLLGVGLGVLQPRLDPGLDGSGLPVVGAAFVVAGSARVGGEWGHGGRSVSI